MAFSTQIYIKLTAKSVLIKTITLIAIIAPVIGTVAACIGVERCFIIQGAFGGAGGIAIAQAG